MISEQIKSRKGGGGKERLQKEGGVGGHQRVEGRMDGQFRGSIFHL